MLNKSIWLWVWTPAWECVAALTHSGILAPTSARPHRENHEPLLYVWQLNDASHFHDLPLPSKHTHTHTYTRTLLCLTPGDAYFTVQVACCSPVCAHKLLIPAELRSCPLRDEGCLPKVVKSISKCVKKKEFHYLSLKLNNVYMWHDFRYRHFLHKEDSVILPTNVHITYFTCAPFNFHLKIRAHFAAL